MISGRFVYRGSELSRRRMIYTSPRGASMKRIALLLALLAGFAQIGISETDAQSRRISMEAAGNSYGILGINLEYSALPFLSIGVGASTCLVLSDVHAFIHLLLPTGNVRPFIGASISGNYGPVFRWGSGYNNRFRTRFPRGFPAWCAPRTNARCAPWPTGCRSPGSPA